MMGLPEQVTPPWSLRGKMMQEGSPALHPCSPSTHFFTHPEVSPSSLPASFLPFPSSVKRDQLGFWKQSPVSAP